SSEQSEKQPAILIFSGKVQKWADDCQSSTNAAEVAFENLPQEYKDTLDRSYSAGCGFGW
ncbi:MAG: hypothetical protein ACLGIF_05075, partial [Actinomycetes bacterium]